MGSEQREVPTDGPTLLSFHQLAGEDGLRIHDAIEQRYLRIQTGSPVDPTPTGFDGFHAPLDRAVSVRTDELRFPQLSRGFVRDADYEVVAEIENFSQLEFEPGTYTVELSGPIKLYFHFDSSLTVETTPFDMSFSFGGETTVTLGARSYHERPAATITTTDDPHDLMQAVSYFGSALKSTGSERSFPTLRGHPPAVELGSELSIPAELERPDTGIRIEVPPDLQSVFVVTPLAYYLGATVVPGPAPRLVTESGFEHDLTGHHGFEAEVERVLQQSFFLDCLTRNEGTYPFEVHERSAVEDLLDLDFAELFGQPIGVQLEAYLSVPFALIEDHVQRWKHTSHLAPEPENIEALPFLVDDLATIRSPEATAVSREEAQSASLEAFMRTTTTRGSDSLTRSQADPERLLPDLVQPEAVDSVEQSWLASDAPVGASKARIEAFQNRLDREPSDGDIDITVVCNDPEMFQELETASGVYGSRDDLPLDVTLYRELDKDRLRFVLETETDFFHYVGHIDDEGIQCTDGKLDITELETVGTDSFFLNACRSYRQGLALLDRGAVGGVVTLDDVLDSGALRVGETLARLLNHGFPLRPALDIAKERSIVGGQYLVVGDGSADITHAESHLPVLCTIEPNSGNFELKIETYPTREYGMGALFQPDMIDISEWYLGSGVIDSFTLTRDELENFLQFEECPIRYNNSIVWSDSLDLK